MTLRTSPHPDSGVLTTVPGGTSYRVRWWQSLRLPLAAAVASVALATALAVGSVVDYRSAVDGRERLRAQATDRLESAALFYDVDGRLRFGATVDPALVPDPLRDVATRGPVSYYDGSTMWASQPLPSGAVMTVQVSGAGLEQQRQALRRTLSLAGVLAILLASLLGWLVATGLSRRLRTGARAARQIATGVPGVRAAQPGRDEVAALTRSVDDMANELRRRLRREQEFSADVAHELRTPVTALVSSSELLPDDEVSRLVRTQVARLRRLVSDLLEISRLEAGRDQVRLEVCDLGDVVKDALDTLPDDGRIELTVTDPVAVLAEPRRVERIVANLVTNARRHGGGDCRVTVAGRTVTVDDDGPGFPAELTEIGPRRFSSHGHGAGSGLGMTIATRHAVALGGVLAFGNRTAAGGHVAGARATLSLRPAP